MGWILCSFSVPVLAQNNDIAKEINRIKRDANYLARESTAENWQEAFDYSLSQLLLQVNIERNKIALDGIKVNDLKSVVQSLSMSRGPLHRVLVYISLSDVSLSNQTNGNLQDPENNRMSSNSNDLADSLSLTPAIITEDDSINNMNRIEPVLVSLGLTETIKDANWQLESFLKEGNVVGYGTIKNKSEIEVGKYLLIFNEKGMILGLLRVQKDGLFNMKTKQFDSTDNYHGCGAIWFK